MLQKVDVELTRIKTKSRSKLISKGKKYCYCHKKGHFIKHCNKKNKDNKGKVRVEGDAVVAAIESESHICDVLVVSSS